MKKLLYTIILLGSSLSALEEDNILRQDFSEALTCFDDELSYNSHIKSFTYYSLGLTHFMLPSFGIGWRMKKQKNTFDLGISASSLLVIYSGDLSASYLYGDKYYFGPGLGVGICNSIVGGSKFLQGKVIVGKNLSSQSFFQIEANLNVEDKSRFNPPPTLIKL